MVRRWLVGAVVLATGCQLGEEPPLFEGVNKVVVQKLGSMGLTRREIGKDLLPKLSTCLQKNTREISAEAASEELLASTYLVEVSDKHGARSFELYTAVNLKGNRGKHYENKCVYEMISRLGL